MLCPNVIVKTVIACWQRWPRTSVDSNPNQRMKHSIARAGELKATFSIGLASKLMSDDRMAASRGSYGSYLLLHILLAHT